MGAREVFTRGGGGIEVGEAGVWLWELVLWRRHLKEPAWVVGAHTHFGTAPWPQADELEDQVLRTPGGDGAW